MSSHDESTELNLHSKPIGNRTLKLMMVFTSTFTPWNV